MEANKLRIGNILIESNGRQVKIMELLTDYARVWINKDEWVSVGYDYLKGIEINEETLVKLGFIKVRDYPVFRLNGLQIEFNGFDSEWGCGLIDKKTVIKYVHDLQNLYYILSGNELNIIK